MMDVFCSLNFKDSMILDLVFHETSSTKEPWVFCSNQNILKIFIF